MLETKIVTGVVPVDRSPRQVAASFRRLLDEGVPLRPAGEARKDPGALLSRGYTPKHLIQLFGASFYLTNLRFDRDFRFFVAYVHLPSEAGTPDGALHPRIFYKDSSLVWRCPSHYIRSAEDNWIGKGDLKSYREGGVLMESSAEETTNLPLELQGALDIVSRLGGHVRRDEAAVPLILRRAPDGRFEPYRDFSEPRRRAMADARNVVNGGRYVASFARDGDPASLRFVPGFEPDFASVIETTVSKSRFYGGLVRKLRILSKNRKIQYQFAAGPKHVWIVPPQTLTTDLSSYAVRTVDVNAAEDLFVPGYEYHFLDESEDPPQLYSQIPEGYAGGANEVDPSRADASAWLEALPVIREFRSRVRL